MPNDSLNAALRKLPSVDEVLNALPLGALEGSLPHDSLVSCIRAQVDSCRAAILAGQASAPSLDAVCSGVMERIRKQSSPSLKRVINATGVVVHTNLGRSALAKEAVEAAEQAAGAYSTLEYDLESMQRGSRHSHCESLICALTGAEAAIAVNNNAAAVLMVLNEFAKGKQAVISRGELIEIGGSFRIPDIMDFSNAQMIEVGTTNKTHPSDYERAITPETAMLLKVHTSNYRLVGFTESVSARELKRVAEAENARRAEEAPEAEPLLVYEDLGSGMLISLPELGNHGEPTVAEALRGCDLVSFSGDKLLGGPQAGVIVGAKPLIDRLKKNPLARALRLDKMTIAALEATLRLYLDPEAAKKSIPTLRMLTASASETETEANRLAELINSACKGLCHATTIPDVSRAGGGSLPMVDIPSFATEVTLERGNAQECVAFLEQRWHVPIIARIGHEKVVFGVRTLLDVEDAEQIAKALTAYLEQAQAPEKE